MTNLPYAYTVHRGQGKSPAEALRLYREDAGWDLPKKTPAEIAIHRCLTRGCGGPPGARYLWRIAFGMARIENRSY